MTSMFGETGAKTPGTSSGFLWTFIKTLAFVMLCGIVGPIFWVMYYVIGDVDGTKWMLWSGMGITILNVVIAFFIARGATRMKAKVARMQLTGHMAIADITSLAQTNMQINDQPVMKLGLRIRGDGVPSFETEIRKTVPIVAQAMLHRRVLAVLVDPATKEFEIDWQATAMLTGSVPSQFTSTEDGRTYDLTGQPEPLIKILEVLRRHGIGTDSVVDLRSNPSARQEVMTIVRQYGYSPQASGQPVGGVNVAPSAGPSAAPTAPGAPSQSLSERLAELDALQASGQITGVEYQQARQRLLGTL